MDESVRQLVRERAGNRCEYCRLPQQALPWARFHVEHVRARQHGGGNELENLALACRRCNAFKGPNLAAIDSETGAMTQLFNPRTDVWAQHFQLIHLEIVGLSAIGRATVDLLNMNDPDRVELRAALTELVEELA